MDVSTLLALLADHGGAAFWAVLKGILLWGTVSLIAGLLLYFLPTRLGWLEPRGQRRRSARIVYGLVIFLCCAPLGTAAGVAQELKGATLVQVRKELERSEATLMVGRLLVTPVALARLLASGRMNTPQALARSFEELSKEDLAFLLQAGDLQKAFQSLTGELVHVGARKVPGYDKTEKNRLLRFLVGRAEKKAAEKAGAKISPYARLFEGLKADPGGGLSFDSAARQVGRNFYLRTLEPAIRGPFNALTLKLLLGAGLLWLLLLLVFQLTGRRAPKTAPPSPPVPSAA